MGLLGFELLLEVAEDCDEVTDFLVAFFVNSLAAALLVEGADGVCGIFNLCTW